MVNDNKSPLLAGFLSLLIPGLGQAYNGQIVKGIVIFVLTIVIWFIYTIIYSICLLIYGLYEGVISIIVIVVPLLAPLLINIFAAHDAIKKAKLHK